MLKRLKQSGFIAVLGLAIASSLTSSPALAAGSSTEAIYYSDATFSQVVGWVIKTCDSRIYKSGIQTEFVEYTTEECS